MNRIVAYGTTGRLFRLDVAVGMYSWRRAGRCFRHDDWPLVSARCGRWNVAGGALAVELRHSVAVDVTYNVAGGALAVELRHTVWPLT